ncbi:MAG TPA: hypothetical protein VLA89_05265 [Gemmatimonadales bacterium]|nr:hypothetical protein [Gemmatimonadales bacterium]
MSVYRVTGRLKYRGHEPGTVFIATLTQDEERRALRRRNIVVLQSGPVTLEEHRIRPPKG